MVYNTENGAPVQKLSDKSQISLKRYWILLLKIVKKESKSLNAFQKLLEQVSQTTTSQQYTEPEHSLSTTRQAGGLNRQTAGVEEIFMMRKLPRNLEMQVAYLNNHSEETIFGSNRIKKQHETMK